MSEPSSERGRGGGARCAGQRVRNECGSTLLLMTLGISLAIGAMVMVVEVGRVYVEVSRLSRAIDAGALAAIRALRDGPGQARQQAFATLEANGVEHRGEHGARVDLSFGVNDQGEDVATLSVETPIPLIFSHLLGQESITLRSSAAAAAPPLDIVLVLGQSASLASAGAWGELQEAAEEFVLRFGEDYDQVGLVSFHTRAVHRFRMDSRFRQEIRSQIRRMEPVGGTNIGDGLKYAREQMHAPGLREGSIKVVVFFTDGLPSVYRGFFEGEERLLVTSQLPTSLSPDPLAFHVGGYHDDPDGLPEDDVPDPLDCSEAPANGSSYSCFGWTAPQIVAAADRQGEEAAARLRAGGVYVYTIGMNDSSSLDYLRLLANQNGVADPSQPRGQAYLAPAPADLGRVFDQVADDIVTRLVQ